MNDYLISVIIPVYNAEKYLLQCLHSLFRQTFHNFELICIDDGSTDSSGKLLDDLAIIHSEMKVLHIKNSGVSTARNLGLSKAKGKYIAFIDSDDTVTPDYLEILYNELIGSNADLVACGYKKVSEHENWNKTEFVNVERFEGDIFGKYIRKEYSLQRAPWGVLYKKEYLPDMPYNPEICIGEDLCFFFTKYFNNLKKISIIKNELYMYLYNPDSITNSHYTKKKIASYFLILNEVMNNLHNFDRKYHNKLLTKLQHHIIHRPIESILNLCGEREEFLYFFYTNFIAAIKNKTLKLKYARPKYKLLILSAFFGYAIFKAVVGFLFRKTKQH